MSGDEQNYPRLIGAKSWKQAISTRDQLRCEDLLAGEETEEDPAYRLRLHSVEALDFKAVICDSCGERPAYGGVFAFGSSEWILACADEKGWTVPKRWGPEMPPLFDHPDLAPLSVCTFGLCESCHPAPGNYVTSVVELGYEESLEAFVRWQSAGQI